MPSMSSSHDRCVQSSPHSRAALFCRISLYPSISPEMSLDRLDFPSLRTSNDFVCNLLRHLFVKRDLHVFDFVPGKNAASHGFLDSLLDRLDVFARHSAADDAIFENEAGAGPARLDRDPHVTVLTAATGLADILAFGIGFGADC